MGRWSRSLGPGALGIVMVIMWVPSAQARMESAVYLNGQLSKVYFNDGDSFRVLEGPLAGSKARLAGYNTLEGYGKVHIWGRKTFRELYVNAKKGTLNARRGPCWNKRLMRYRPGCNKAWHCTSDMTRDGYGRILWWCPDLAFSQVRQGLAHVLSVQGPRKPNGAESKKLANLVEAQRLAVQERLGMWSRGVPEFILTSLHSFDEPYAQEKGTAYNRLVSVADGHSQKWLHKRVYKECDKVCRMEVLEPDAIVNAAQALKADPAVAPFIAKYDAEALIKIVRRFAEIGEVYWTADEHAAAMEQALAPMRQDGRLGKLKVGSCMHHAGYKRRFGANAASCLY